MRSRLPRFEESGPRIFVPLLIAIVVIGLIMFVQWSGPMRPVIGVVESSGAVQVARIAGGTRESASVRLPDGRLVFAFVSSGGPLEKGDRVRVIEQRQRMGSASYEIVAKAAPEAPQ